MTQPIRIALADDHAMVREGLAAMLRADPHFEVVAEAPDGAALLEQLAALGTPPDVCLLDMQMPVMDGYQTLKALKERYSAIEAIVLSQFDDDFAIIRMLVAGACGYLHKDSDPAELKEALIAAHAGRYFHNKLVNKHLKNLIARRGDESLPLLSDEEILFLRYACSDLTYNGISGKMGLSKRQVEHLGERLFEKLGVKSRVGLAVQALRMGLQPLE